MTVSIGSTILTIHDLGRLLVNGAIEPYGSGTFDQIAVTTGGNLILGSQNHLVSTDVVVQTNGELVLKDSCFLGCSTAEVSNGVLSISDSGDIDAQQVDVLDGGVFHVNGDATVDNLVLRNTPNLDTFSGWLSIDP